MSEIATRILSALAQRKRAISEHAQEHAPPFMAAVFDTLAKSVILYAIRSTKPKVIYILL